MNPIRRVLVAELRVFFAGPRRVGRALAAAAAAASLVVAQPPQAQPPARTLRGGGEGRGGGGWSLAAAAGGLFVGRPSPAGAGPLAADVDHPLHRVLGAEFRLLAPGHGERRDGGAVRLDAALVVHVDHALLGVLGAELPLFRALEAVRRPLLAARLAALAREFLRIRHPVRAVVFPSAPPPFSAWRCVGFARKTALVLAPDSENEGIYVNVLAFTKPHPTGFSILSHLLSYSGSPTSRMMAIAQWRSVAVLIVAVLGLMVFNIQPSTAAAPTATEVCPFPPVEGPWALLPVASCS